MKQTRPKYKVRWRRGRNAMRRIWKRTERNHRKWKAKKTGRRRRSQRRFKPLTARNSSSNETRLGGGVTSRRGKLKRWRQKQGHGRLGRKRRYGGGQSVSTVKRRKERRKQKRKRMKSCYRRSQQESRFIKGRNNESLRTERRELNPHRRGNRERRAEVRRRQAGRAQTRGGARQRITHEGVRKVGGMVDVTKHDVVLRDTRERRSPGEGRKIAEMEWKKRKPWRKRWQFGRIKQSYRKGINGRSARGYVLVDYRTGRRWVKWRPHTGEVRRPARIQRARWMF